MKNRNREEDSLPVIVFSMEHPFTYDEVRVRFSKEGESTRKKHEEVDINELMIGVYLNRLVRFGILKHRGPRFWFESM